VEGNVRRAALEKDPQSGESLGGYVFPKKLVFDLPESVLKQIEFAETSLGDEITASDTHVLEFRDYGKRLIGRCMCR
jgi:Choline/Carnitine o-acyltransferase